MHLQAIWLSNLCDGSGYYLSNFAWKGSGQCPAEHLWPLTIVPSASKWRVWQQALQNTLHLDQWWQLGLPIGEWLVDGELQG